LIILWLRVVVGVEVLVVEVVLVGLELALVCL
jgi:hypothetical protein